MNNQNLASLLHERVLIFDGAMGTEIYQRHIFTNRCYDELCLSDPKIISDIHRLYAEAGADILTTNSFGANTFDLQKFGFADKTAAICRQAAKLAREIADQHNLLVAGSIGPLPDDKFSPTTREQRIAALKLQIGALQEGGADFIIFETIPNQECAQEEAEAMLAFPDLAFVISFAITDDSDISAAVAARIKIAGNLHPAALGFNCGLGPDTMLQAVETAAPLTNLPLIIQPNSGVPHKVDNRQLYLCSPEYLTTYAVRYVSLGARAVGGCCGTTPEHIADLVRAIKPLGKHHVEIKSVPENHTEETPKQPECPLAQRSRLGKKLAEGQWVTTIEISPPRGWDTQKILENAKICAEAGVDVINVPDGPRAAPRLSAFTTALLIQQNCNIETVLHVCARDRNFIGLQGDLLGCAAVGLNNLLFITGDPPKLGNYAFSSGVFDTDSIGLVKLQKGLNQGIELSGLAINPPTHAVIGVGADPSAIDFNREVSRLREKIAAGADYITTQPVFDPDALKRFLEAVGDDLKPVFAGIWPLASMRNALFMKNEVPGVVVPDSILERMAKMESREDQQKVGIEIAREAAEIIRPYVAGLQVSAPLGNVRLALEVLK